MLLNTCSASQPAPTGYPNPQVSDNLARYTLKEGKPMYDELPDLIASVVYDILTSEGIIKKFTIDDAIAFAIDDIFSQTVDKNYSVDDIKGVAHGVIKDLVQSICPACDDCFSLAVNGEV